MKIESSRQVWTEQTNGRTEIVTPWAPVGAKNIKLRQQTSAYTWLEMDDLRKYLKIIVFKDNYVDFKSF